MKAIQKVRDRVCQTSSPVPQLLKATQTKIKPKQLGDNHQDQQESLAINKQIEQMIFSDDQNFK